MTLDGTSYNVTITWNVSAQRYYINVYTLDGTWIITTALVSTPPARDIASVVYDPFLSLATVTMVDPTLWPVPLAHEGLVTPPGTVIDYTLEGFTPDTYNGLVRALQINPTTFTFPLATDPGPVVVMGKVNRLINMIQSLFSTSSLVYRNAAFEINP
jgi:hypothetical protein